MQPIYVLKNWNVSKLSEESKERFFRILKKVSNYCHCIKNLLFAGLSTFVMYSTII